MRIRRGDQGWADTAKSPRLHQIHVNSLACYKYKGVDDEKVLSIRERDRPGVWY